MRKLNKGRKLSMRVGPRKMLLRVLVNNFLMQEKIKTTEAKAKELRSVVEKMIEMHEAREAKKAALYKKI